MGREKHPEEKVFWIVGLAVVALFGVPGVFIFFFHDIDGGGPSEWAEFGTYFSGIATPVIAFCSALLFYRSIIVQRDEFEKTRKEMESAKKLQISVENTRNMLTRQEQIEKALPHARSLQKLLLSNLLSYEFESHKSASNDEIEEQFEWYVSRSLNVVVMITEYLDCGGDIYLVLNDIKEIMSEKRQLQNLISDSPISETPEATAFFQALANLYHRRAEELDKYAGKTRP